MESYSCVSPKEMRVGFRRRKEPRGTLRDGGGRVWHRSQDSGPCSRPHRPGGLPLHGGKRSRRRKPSNPSMDKDAYYQFLLATEAIREGRLEEARSLLDKAIGFDPDSAFLHVELAIVMTKLGSLESAEEMARKALALDSRLVPAYLLLGNLYTSSRRKEDGIAIYRKLVAIDPELEEPQLLLGELLRETNRTGEAEEVLEQLVENLPGSYLGHYHLGQNPGRGKALRRGRKEHAAGPADQAPLSSRGEVSRHSLRPRREERRRPSSATWRSWR